MPVENEAVLINTSKLIARECCTIQLQNTVIYNK
jgi:hypothetical protein